MLPSGRRRRVGSSCVMPCSRYTSSLAPHAGAPDRVARITTGGLLGRMSRQQNSNPEVVRRPVRFVLLANRSVVPLAGPQRSIIDPGTTMGPSRACPHHLNRGCGDLFSDGAEPLLL